MRRYILIFLIVLGIILLFMNTNFASIIENIKHIPVKIFILILALQIITILSIGFQWKSVLSIIGIKRDFYNILKVNLKGNIFDAITPGSKVGGELARLYGIKNNLNLSLNNSLVILGLQKCISIFSFISLGLVSLLYFYRGKNSIFINKDYYYILLAILLLGLFIIVTLIIRPTEVKKFINRFTFSKKEVLKDFLNVYIENIENVNNNKKKLMLNIALGLFIWALYAIKLIILVRIFNNDISIFRLGAITYISYAIGGIPLLPGGIGTFESALAGLLLVSGLNLEEAMVISVIFRFVTFWFEFAASGIVILLDKIIKKEVKGGEYVEKQV